MLTDVLVEKREREGRRGKENEEEERRGNEEEVVWSHASSDG